MNISNKLSNDLSYEGLECAYFYYVFPRMLYTAVRTYLLLKALVLLVCVCSALPSYLMQDISYEQFK